MSDSVASRYESVMQQVRDAASGRAVEVIAVSKRQPIEAIEEVYALGHRDFGENYVQEIDRKNKELTARGCDQIRWHLIGNLQTNKVKMLVPHVSVVHTVHSEKLANELNKRWEGSEKLPVFIQVNIDEEDSKSGVYPKDVRLLVEAISKLEKLELRGLMCIPAADRVEKRKPFDQLNELEKSMRPLTHGDLSMGMTSDFVSAIESGASCVRVGTAIFGARES